jgi:hypothetical protein
MDKGYLGKRFFMPCLVKTLTYMETNLKKYLSCLPPQKVLEDLSSDIHFPMLFLPHRPEVFPELFCEFFS